MVQTIDLGTKVAIGIVSLICYAELIIGIAEAYYVSKYNNVSFKGDCTIANSIISGGMINDIIAGLVGSCFISYLIYYCSKIIDHNNVTVTNIGDCFGWIFKFHVFKFGYLVACLITYRNNILCYHYIIDNTPEFWTFIMIHFVTGCCIMGSICIACITALYFKMYDSLIKMYKVVPVNDTNKLNDSDDMLIEMKIMN